MARTRISTTVDTTRLEAVRSRSGLRDSELFDQALELLGRRLAIDEELAALDRFPYELDPELNVGNAPGDPEAALPYNGAIPQHIERLAAERRAERKQQRRAS